MTQTVESFAELQLSTPLLTALAEVGYETPSPIQAECIPHLLGGRDVLGEAQTGTGKTAAFALPLLEKIDLAKFAPQVLVLTPTRELAIQVSEAFQKYARYMRDFHVLPIYGGQSMVVQLRQLKRGAHVIVGTPGRVMDHLERQSLVLDDLKAVVLDEADEMLRMGFIDDVEWILQHAPAERQTALFSATMPDTIRRIAHQHLREPQEVKIRAATSTVSTITQHYWQVRGVNKLDALTRILEAQEDLDAAIVFVRTKTATVELADKLEARGYAAAAINGDMTQGLRERAIEQLKTGTLDILVATDVAARGIDVPRVSHVINYDIPYDTEAYVHRIGRTGRAGRAGNAILFVAPREKGMLRAIERATKQPITPISLPTREAVVDRRTAQLKQQVLDAIEAEDMQFFSEIIDELEEEHDLSIQDIASALLYLVQRERPIQVEEAGSGWDIATAPYDAERRFDRRDSREGQDRGPREPRAERGERAPKRDFGDAKLLRYRIEVGRQHGVTPKEIVGAIANEGGIEGRYIGQIDLFGDYSIVELPPLPNELLSGLQRTRVRQVPINIRLAVAGEGEKRDFRESRERRDDAGDRPYQPRERRDSGFGSESPRRDRGAERSQFPKRNTFSGDAPPKRSFKNEGPFGDRAPKGVYSEGRAGYGSNRDDRNDRFAKRGDAAPQRAPSAGQPGRPGENRFKTAPKSTGKPKKRY